LKPCDDNDRIQNQEMDKLNEQGISIRDNLCNGCGRCAKICPANAIAMVDGMPRMLDPNSCTLCGVCADQCPEGAIALRIPKPALSTEHVPEARKEFVEFSQALNRSLALDKRPVAIRLVRMDEKVPETVPAMNFPIRHCVSLNMASLGAVLFVPADKHACSAAKAALGIENLPGKVEDGTVPFMHGLAGSKEAASRIMREIPRLQAGTTRGTLLAPLERAFFDPDVVVLTVLPKQAMWIANALLFESGSPRISANFAGMQASCSDVTTLPILTQKVNFSLGCYGCRLAGKLADEEMYVGIPTARLQEIVKGLKGLKRAMEGLSRG